MASRLLSGSDARTAPGVAITLPGLGISRSRATQVLRRVKPSSSQDGY